MNEQKQLLKKVFCKTTKADTGRSSVKKMFLKISHYSQENTFVRASFLVKLETENCSII